VDNNTYGMDHAQSADSSFEQDDEYISQFVLNQKVTEDTDKTRKEEERKKSEPESKDHQPDILKKVPVKDQYVRLEKDGGMNVAQ
jgi:hypothetical protein